MSDCAINGSALLMCLSQVLEGLVSGGISSNSCFSNHNFTASETRILQNLKCISLLYYAVWESKENQSSSSPKKGYISSILGVKF